MAIKVSKMAKKGRILPKMTKNVLKSPKMVISNVTVNGQKWPWSNKKGSNIAKNDRRKFTRMS